MKIDDVRNELALLFDRNRFRREPGRPRFAHALYVLAIPVIVCWVALAGVLNLAVPQLETVIKEHARSFLPDDAPSVQAISKMGQYFGQTGTNNFVYVLLEGDKPLGSQAHEFHDKLLATLTADTEHVVSALDLWSEPDFAAANESADGKSAYTLVNLAGNMGTALAMESTQAVRDTIAGMPAPPGIQVHVTGPSAIVNDELVEINDSILIIMVTCAALIAIILFWVYRSPITVALPLLTVGMGIAVARPLVAFLGDHGIIGVSIFASALLLVIVLGAGTDYGIFLLGRYQEARRAGEDPASAYYTAMRGTQHIILASGITVAGATACMCVTRLAIFSTAGLPCTIGIAATLAAALTLGPALLALGSRLGFFEPKPQPSLRRWRRIATTVVRWPGPVLVGAMSVLIVLMLLVPTLRVSYNERITQPGDTPANLGFAAADRHFPPNIMAPSLFLIEADHDMRNPADLLALAKVTNAILQIRGIDNVQGITRPLGIPLEQATLPNQAGYIGNRIDQITSLLTQRLDDLNALGALLGRLNGTISGARKALTDTNQGFDRVNDSAAQLQSQLTDVTTKLADIRGTAEPARQFIGSLPNCQTLAPCQSVLTGFALLDDVDRINAPITGLADGARTASSTLPQLSTQIGSLTSFVDQLTQLISPLQAALGVLIPQISQITEFTNEIRDTFAEGTPNEFFFLPSQAFESPLFHRALPLFFSADGKVTRMIVTPEMEGFSREAMDVAAELVPTALQAMKGTSLAGSTVSVGGPGGTLLNLEAFTKEDFTTSVVAAFAFVFCVILILLRSLVAAITVISTVAIAYLSALGLSILIWQHLLDNPLHWSVAPIAFTFLVAVGADYNLLLVARFKEELPAGIKTGIIRSMVNTGGVVTTAGLVFGLTMFGMLASSAHNIAQIGTVVGIGLFLDTLIVRSYVIPAIASLTGRWFWWPENILRRRAAVDR
ncbi:RND family transporter [Mycolicibacterium wolinskyi]|uniref:MMPL/RND family transporter n=1 Tax=Mycolicibacterium wolinskyi TaxID=59750 RepID=UPI00391798E9